MHQSLSNKSHIFLFYKGDQIRKINNFYVLVLAGLSLTACGNQQMDESKNMETKSKAEESQSVPAKEAGMAEPGDMAKNEEDKNESSADQAKDEGKVLPEFTSKDQDGNPFTKKDLAKNEATVINLWFTGCSACIEEMDELNDLADVLKKQDGVDFISMCTDVSYDESTKEAYERIMKDKKPTYKALAVDYEGAIKDYLEGIFVYPTTIVVDKNGKIIGDPVEGTLLPEEQKAKLNENIKKAIESSKAS